MFHRSTASTCQIAFCTIIPANTRWLKLQQCCSQHKLWHFLSRTQADSKRAAKDEKHASNWKLFSLLSLWLWMSLVTSPAICGALAVKSCVIKPAGETSATNSMTRINGAKLFTTSPARTVMVAQRLLRQPGKSRPGKWISNTFPSLNDNQGGSSNCPLKFDLLSVAAQLRGVSPCISMSGKQRCAEKGCLQ